MLINLREQDIENYTEEASRVFVGFCYLSAGSIFRFKCRMYCGVVKYIIRKVQTCIYPYSHVLRTMQHPDLKLAVFVW